VQVLKEGIGTKGPTLTSYISIPGRLLVMMPQMDKVGVSRKVDDEDQRREMRRILDSLELPEGFGFILRTAGFDRTKTELQRDAIYLQRLWEAMERRTNSTGAPCALYTESDLLVRTIRDVADDSVEAIVVDSESAFTRAKTFLQVVAPINAPTTKPTYTSKSPCKTCEPAPAITLALDLSSSASHSCTAISSSGRYWAQSGGTFLRISSAVCAKNCSKAWYCPAAPSAKALAFKSASTSASKGNTMTTAGASVVAAGRR
jgi:hypothetical protein